MNFEGKKILVTGATGGIGGAIVKKFLSLNAKKTNDLPLEKVNIQMMFVMIIRPMRLSCAAPMPMRG